MRKPTTHKKKFEIGSFAPADTEFHGEQNYPRTKPQTPYIFE